MRPEILAHARYLAAFEVGPNIADLVMAFAISTKGSVPVTLMDLSAQAWKLLQPVADYASAACDLGWRFNGDTASLMFVNEREARLSSAIDWKALCREHGIKGHKLDIVEVRIVSAALSTALSEVGEQTSTDFTGLCVWARTRNLDPAQDPAIQAIASEQVLRGTACRDKMFGRSQVAALMAAAQTGLSLMDDAIDAHIYSDDDEPADDCPYTENVEDVGNAVRSVALEFGLRAD